MAISGGYSQAPQRNTHSTGTIAVKFLDVKNVSFARRYGNRGQGEIFQVTFDVYNKISKPMDLKFFVIGFHEKDNVNPSYRRRVEYPKWRPKDFDKENLQIILLDSIPNINKSRINPNIDKENEFVFPDFLSYVTYLDKYPATGIPFKLYGIRNTDLADPVIKKSYQITNTKLKTSIIALLYTDSKPEKMNFFNHVGIIIYDAQGQTVFRQFYRLKHEIRLR